jgi:hypothetical protein
LVAGEHLALMMTQSRAGSNAKAKREFAWHSASWRDGFAQSNGNTLSQRVSPHPAVRLGFLPEF